MLEQLLSMLLSGGGSAIDPMTGGPMAQARPVMPSMGAGMGFARPGGMIDPMTGMPLEGIGRPGMGGFNAMMPNMGGAEQDMLRFLIQQSLGGAPRRYAPGISPARQRPTPGRLDLNGLLTLLMGNSYLSGGMDGIGMPPTPRNAQTAIPAMQQPMMQPFDDRPAWDRF